MLMNWVSILSDFTATTDLPVPFFTLIDALPFAACTLDEPPAVPRFFSSSPSPATSNLMNRLESRQGMPLLSTTFTFTSVVLSSSGCEVTTSFASSPHFSV